MTLRVCDLGRMRFRDCAVLQAELLERVANGDEPSTLIFVEHERVLTLGASFHAENLLFDRADYEARGIEIEPTNRGGDVTYHGPGQLVIYPIFNLEEFGKDLHRWLRDLEQTIIGTLASLKLVGERMPPDTGVWVDELKIAAIGIKVRRWVSMHGIALNCDADLAAFDSIVPCGIRDRGVTSVSARLGRPFGIEEAKPLVLESFQSVFGAKFEIASAIGLSVASGQ